MRKVMLVEDEELILEGLNNIINWEELNIQVVHKAHNGEEALAKWEQEPVDLIVTDIHMPVMTGLEFLAEIRKRDKRVRCVILTGYDEFEYARSAVGLDVEDYILKPIDEEKLEDAVSKAVDKLAEMDRFCVVDIDDKAGWLQLLKGQLSREEAKEYLELLPVVRHEEAAWGYAAVMKIDLESLQKAKMSDVLYELQKEEECLRTIYLSADSLLLLFYGETEDEEKVRGWFLSLQSRLESDYGIRTFISAGAAFEDYSQLPDRYKEAMKLQKYQVIEGYGNCVMPSSIHKRLSADITIDDKVLRKLIFRKDTEGAFTYIEDLFINNIKKDADVDDIYQMSLRIAMILQEIKKEYKLTERKHMQNLTDIIESIYHAQDLFALKIIFIGEVIEIITCLNEDDSGYTPVVKQIMSEVQKNYRQGMNLKTLSYKYHMNASYLGQIFQKEVGCSFAQFLSNTKNSIAKDLILNTNMRINDIAKEVGYPDTSYFYRKFKQCYGVSPASLREMKKYPISS